MTQRDKYILGVLPVIGLIAIFWVMALGPKRDELRKLDKRVGQSEQAVQSTRQEAQQFARDRLGFPHTYATVVRLGKAAPADPDVASLLVQLERAADLANVDFRKISLDTKGSGAAPGGSPTPAPSSAPPAGGTSSTPAGGSQGTTGASGTQSPSTPGSQGSSQSQPGASGTTGGGGATGSPSAPSGGTTGAAPAPANAVATADQPIGTVVGSAQLPILRFSLRFQGNFFKMADFVHNVRSLVRKQGKRLSVSGRLLTIDAISFSEGDFGFPQVKANMTATAYLVPASQGLLAGATPQGPGGATASTPTPISSPSGTIAPPSAVVTTP